jgi:multiple sugar transport system ATP-binding protein
MTGTKINAGMSKGRLVRVEKFFGTTRIIQGVDLDIQEGELLVFVGPSWCGKSTLLRMIAGLDEIDGGLFLLNGLPMNEVPSANRGIAMVFQSYALYPHMSVRQNLSFGLETARVPRAQIEAAVERASRILHIEHLLDRKPRALSGGQRQRVAIGRAIVREPQLFLFDEPLSNLDAELRNEMRVEIVKLQKSLATSMIYVTHDQTEAMTMADRIVVLREGKVEQVGAPIELYEHPINRFVASFIGAPRMNFMEGYVRGSSDNGINVELAGPGVTVAVPVQGEVVSAGEPVVLGIRPGSLSCTGSRDADPALDLNVQLVEPLGGSSLIYGTAPNKQDLVVQEPGHSPLKRGDTVGVRLPLQECHLFRENGRAFRRRSNVPTTGLEAESDHSGS